MESWSDNTQKVPEMRIRVNDFISYSFDDYFIIIHIGFHW